MLLYKNEKHRIRISSAEQETQETLLVYQATTGLVHATLLHERNDDEEARAAEMEMKSRRGEKEVGCDHRRKKKVGSEGSER